MSETDWDNIDYGNFNRGNTAFPDEDAPNPFPDGSSAKGFGRSATSNFSGTHTACSAQAQFGSRMNHGYRWRLPAWPHSCRPTDSSHSRY
jgi:hypothetical protein